MKLHVISGPALSGKTDHLAREMQRCHRLDPLSYTFLGPSGAMVKEFSEWMARSLNTSLPRGNFLVIDQFAFELFRRAHPDMAYADIHLYGLLVAGILSEAGREDLGCFYPLKDSPALREFVAEAARDARDGGTEMLLSRLANQEARELVLFVLRELEELFGSRIFDTFHAYRHVDSREVGDWAGSRFGRTLFIDGFANLSDSQISFLSRTIPLFQEAFMTVDPALMDPESWRALLDALLAQSVQIDETRLQGSEEVTGPLERLLRGRGPAARLSGDHIQVAAFRDPEEELVQVCREIKRQIVDQGLCPGEVAVVLNNFSERAREFSRKLEDYGVPVRMSGDQPLSRSVAVQLLIMPFRAAVAGYPPHLLISMLDHGLGSPGAARFEVDGLERLAEGAGLYLGPRRSTLSDRRTEWAGKLADHLAALRGSVEALSRDETVYDGEVGSLEEDIGLCQDLMHGSDQLFQSLEGLEAARARPADISYFRAEMERWMGPLKERLKGQLQFAVHGKAAVDRSPDMSLDRSPDGSQNRSLDRSSDRSLDVSLDISLNRSPDVPLDVSLDRSLESFEQILERLESILSLTGGREMVLSRFMAFTEMLLASEELGEASPDGGVEAVDILPLHSARFRHRHLKFVVNFTDGVYPDRRANPLYRLQGAAGEPARRAGYSQEKEQEQRAALYSCLCTCSRAVVTCPQASREGEPLVPSLWLQGWTFDRERPWNPADPPMSSSELKVEFGSALSRGLQPVVPPEARGLTDPLKAYTGAGFSWRIAEQEVARALVGNGISYSKLSLFKKCPFRFFLTRMLRLEEPGKESFRYSLSPLEKGLAYHAALKVIYDRRQGRAKRDGESAAHAAAPADTRTAAHARDSPESVDLLVDEVVEEIMPRFMSASSVRSIPAVRSRMAMDVASAVRGYLQFELEHPEKAYLGERTITELPFRLSLAEMGRILPQSAQKYGQAVFQGRIDRIDLKVAEKKQNYDMVLSDYKSGEAGDWDQLKLYTLVLLCLGCPDLPRDPRRLKAIFRLVKKGSISRKLDAIPDQGRMDLASRPRSSCSFSEVDQELLCTLDRIFEAREFLPGMVLAGTSGCYNCGFRQDCQSIVDWRMDGGMMEELAAGGRGLEE